MTMTFCHVFFLRAYDLEQVVEGEHEEKTLKWAKARIGLTRAMERIARSINGLDPDKRNRWETLDGEGRNAIIERMLSNMFHPSHLEDAFLRRNLELREIDDVQGMLKRILIRLDDIEKQHEDSTKMVGKRLGKLENMMLQSNGIEPSSDPDDNADHANGEDHEDRRPTTQSSAKISAECLEDRILESQEARQVRTQEAQAGIPAIGQLYSKCLMYTPKRVLTSLAPPTLLAKRDTAY